jgi:gliding motility-associated-like protein
MPISATVYTVTGTSVYGCSDKSYAGVDLAPEIPVYFTANPKKGCSPLPVEYNLISNGLIDTNSLQWNFGDPLTSSDFSNSTAPHYTYTDQGNFIVSINALSIYGCPASGYDTITVWPNPIADFVTHPEIGQSDDPRITFYDQSTGATAWNWNFGNPLSGTDNFSSQQFPIHYYDNAGEYTVQLIVSNDFNCLDTVVKSLKMLESFAFFVPNAFTPNGDGNNEGFKGMGVGIDENRFEMRIFDRWGKEIFMTKDYNESWDGKTGVKDVLSEQTIYVWQVNVADKSGMQHNLNGMVALIR